jgi:tellurite resistance protein
MEFNREIEISEHEAELMARGLYAVARAEGGVHEREEMLIGEFVADTIGGAVSLAALARQAAPTAEELKTLSADAGRLFLKTCLLLAYVDGNYHIDEAKVIRAYAAALGLAEAELTEMENGVREYLLSQLVHLKNTDATREVAKKLGM